MLQALRTMLVQHRQRAVQGARRDVQLARAAASRRKSSRSIPAVRACCPGARQARGDDEDPAAEAPTPARGAGDLTTRTLDGLALRETLLRRSLTERLGSSPRPPTWLRRCPSAMSGVQLALEAQLRRATRGEAASQRKYVADVRSKGRAQAARANPTLAATGRGSGDRQAL